MVKIGKWGVIVHFFHAEYHSLRKRRLFPQEIREYIKNHFKPTSNEMYQELVAARARNELNHDLKDLTDHNVRYWWSLVQRERIETDPDPWKSTVNYLTRQFQV